LFYFPQNAAYFQEEPEFSIEILTPLPGEAVQGLVQIVGTVDAENFQSYQLEFTFQGSSPQNWFLIHQSTTPIIDGILGEWNTTVLADRTYNIRLTVFRQNSEALELIVVGVRVRNYSPIETSTPTPTEAEQAATPTMQTPETPTLTSTPILSPTPFPENEAAVNLERVKNAVFNGTATGLVLIVFILIYRTRINKNK
jgi:hypothetical protein